MATALKPKRPALSPRYEPPTLEDALYAAEGLSDDKNQQLELAAELMRLPVAEVRIAAAPILKAKALSLHSRLPVDAGRGAAREVVVEYKNARKFTFETRNATRALPGSGFSSRS